MQDIEDKIRVFKMCQMPNFLEHDSLHPSLYPFPMGVVSCHFIHSVLFVPLGGNGVKQISENV